MFSVLLRNREKRGARVIEKVLEQSGLSFCSNQRALGYSWELISIVKPVSD
jgi:hypothetical protein